MIKNFGYELSMNEIMEQIEFSVLKKKPYSLVRFGHGEMNVVGYKIYKNANFEYYYKYAGITEINEGIALKLVNALKKADVVGITNHTERTNKDLKKILDYYKLKLNAVCNAWIFEAMIKKPEFFSMLKPLKIVVVGRRSKESIKKFKSLGVEVVGNIGHEGFSDMPKTIKAVKNMRDFDIALVSAGVPATIMCPEIARITGKVALDFGHALDVLIDGNKFDDEKLVANFNKKLW